LTAGTDRSGAERVRLHGRREADCRTPVQYRAAPMINIKDMIIEMNAIIDAECIEFGNWLIKAVIEHPGLSMVEYLMRWKDD